ncbi:ras guanine nucleotide exchange factor domain-containing protein [Xylogone sp. PMI_703]|nr:ras guanine nucleotide exchange factor domain-containing protein [Xylogone sp. PMI_703]
MDEVGFMPAPSQSRHTRSSNPTQPDSRRGDPSIRTSTTSSSSPSATATTSRTPGPSNSVGLSPTPIPITTEPQLLNPKVETAKFHQYRDSVTSIKDDPFFRNYQSPHTEFLSRELRTASYAERMEEEDEDVSDSPQFSAKNASVNLPPQSRSGMGDINIAVIGSVGVGKSTFIQKALGLRGLPNSASSSTRMSVDNVVYTVSLIELDLESFDIIQDKRIQWPKQINGQIVPRMDGALLLYDVMNRESIIELPQTLNALVNSALSTILVSCKCDNPENARQINVENMEAACSSAVEAVKFASNVPESARMCLSSMLRAIMTRRNAAAADAPGPRRRATSSANIEAPPGSNGRPSSPQSKHNRASSEYSLLKGFPSPPLVSPGGQRISPRPGRTNLHHNFTIPDPHDAPPLSSHPAFRPDKNQEKNVSGGARDNTFLETEESSDVDSSNRYSDDIPILQRNDDSFFDKPAKVIGVTFDELVDRLLAQNMSRSDNNFVDIFLCLYRKFAAPGELFDAIIVRLQKITDDKNTHYLTRTTAQLRIVNIIAKWVSTYPGDFASSSTSQKLDAFINELATDPVFAAAAQDMRTQLQSRVVVDDDTGWARTDADVDREVMAGISHPSSPLMLKSHARTDVEGDVGRLNIEDEQNENQESQIDLARAVSPTQSISPTYHTVEDYEREAATMIPRSMIPLTKFRYHIFMDTSDDDFADEMTRIDWVMFSSIRLRDMVRHVSLSLEEKEKCKSLSNVNRMINHFNHIARWVANMILIRDKPKHRALVLEKFMNIALKLRQLNNYNGLAAVLAGINGTAIHRLAQTRSLVPADVQKRFARLVLLMGTQKSHFAYRLAWENSSLPRIPFIPLHRRDLVSAEEGGRTFVGANGERINWKKFEVLAEVILPIMKSQITPYPNLTRHDTAREFILDCRMPIDDEDIYQRSLQVENPSGAVEVGKKKFPWFQK